MTTKISAKQLADFFLVDQLVSPTAAISTSKLADGLLFSKSDGSVPYISPVAGITPTLPTHLATKAYVDAFALGLDAKQSVRAATTANLPALSGLLVVDGVTLVAGDRVLVKNQTTASANDVYVVSAGAWTRAADAATNSVVSCGMHTFVEEGTTQAATGWVMNTPNPIVIGTTNLNFVQFSSAGVMLPGNGLTQTGNTFNVTSGNGGLVSSAGLLTLTLADSTLNVSASGVKLSALNSGNILVGSAANVATGVALSGDATLTNAGALVIANAAITAAKIAANAVDEAHTKRQAAGAFLIGQGISADMVASAMSGDVTMTQAGVTTVASNLVRVTDFITNETPSGLLNGVNVTFTLANTPRSMFHLFLNGQMLDSGTGNDYTITGNTITMLFALASTDKLRANYIK